MSLKLCLRRLNQLPLLAIHRILTSDFPNSYDCYKLTHNATPSTSIQDLGCRWQVIARFVELIMINNPCSPPPLQTPCLSTALPVNASILNLLRMFSTKLPTLKDLAAEPHFAVSDMHGCRARRTQKFVLRQACRREGQRSLLFGC